MHKSQAPLLAPFPEGIPTFMGSVGLYVARPGNLPVPVLHNDWDVFWVRGGECIWELKSGERLVAGAGDFALLPPYTYAVTREGHAPVSFWFCHFDLRPVGGALREQHRADRLGPGRGALVPLSFTRREAPGVWRAYRALTRLVPLRPGPPWRLERAVLALVAELALLGVSRARRGAGGRLLDPAAVRDERITELRKRIDLEPLHPWRISELADAVDLSAGHLHALARTVLGKSLKRYIVEARLRHAMRLLKERPAGRLPSVKEVSAACGFSSQHFFSRQFKRYFHFSPLQYRDGATLEG